MVTLLPLLVIAVACFDALALYARRSGVRFQWLAGDRVGQRSSPEKFYRDRALPFACGALGMSLALLATGTARAELILLVAYCLLSVVVFTGNYLYERRLRRDGAQRS